MTSSITSTNGALILEEPLIRTPFELLRRSHRSAQRQVEKDFNAVSIALQSISKSLNASSSSDEGRQSLVKKLGAVEERAKGLKRKLDDLQPNTNEPTPLRSRLEYLNTLVPSPGIPSTEEKETKPTNGHDEMEVDGEEKEKEIKSTTPSSSTPTSDNTMDRYIVDYLLRTGRLKAAEALSKKQNIEPLVDIKLFAELNKIENALIENHSCAEALAWCGENRGTLKKTKNNLEFTLRLQEFIEICRKRDMTSAITYSRKNLAPWASTHLADIQQGMILLTFGEKTDVNSYKKLYDPSRWAIVRDQFRSTFLTLYSLPSQSVLSLALSAGLSSLRLPSCVQHVKSTSQSKDSESNSALKNDTLTSSSSSPHIPLLPAAPPLHNLESILVNDAFGGDSGSGGGNGSGGQREHFTSPLGGDLYISHHHLTHPHTHTSNLVETQNIAENKVEDDGDEDDEEDLHTHPDKKVGNVDCPTCDENLKVLTAELPLSHHVNSTIVCRLSGKLMDSENQPLAFPNGYVYSTNALREMANSNFDVVTCPRTRETCAFSRLRKVYIS
ncbi:uncharacterized protein L201_004282 [Kwoniella dendrophila CBS 6074]|uniref:Macrophage erythroblast attacher n=1 Tax=Kwoniella dendrophila CBS 6074 TaxID=1295534 RepID=A0AAX4JXU2_9TREE